MKDTIEAPYTAEEVEAVQKWIEANRRALAVIFQIPERLLERDRNVTTAETLDRVNALVRRGQ